MRGTPSHPPCLFLFLLFTFAFFCLVLLLFSLSCLFFSFFGFRDGFSSRNILSACCRNRTRALYPVYAFFDVVIIIISFFRSLSCSFFRLFGFILLILLNNFLNRLACSLGFLIRVDFVVFSRLLLLSSSSFRKLLPCFPQT